MAFIILITIFSQVFLPPPIYLVPLEANTIHKVGSVLEKKVIKEDD